MFRPVHKHEEFQEDEDEEEAVEVTTADMQDEDEIVSRVVCLCGVFYLCCVCCVCCEGPRSKPLTRASFFVLIASGGGGL